MKQGNTNVETVALKNSEESGNDKIPKTIGKNSVSLNFLAVIVLLCTLLTIVSVVNIAKKTTQEIGQMMNDHEYMKVGGEENYKLLREIQKDQMTTYIQDLSEKDPKYIERLKRKIKNLENGKKTLTLTQEEIMALKSDAYIQGNTWTLLTIVEFSNFTCNFCRDFHNEWILWDILKNNQNTVNYIFKHIPSKDYPDATLFSQGGKCILSNTWGQAYIDYINQIFAYTGSSELMTTSGIIYKSAENIGIQKEVLDTCMSSEIVMESLDRDTGQGIFLGIRSVPSILLLNNETREYIILEGKVEKSAIQEQIDGFIK